MITGYTAGRIATVNPAWTTTLEIFPNAALSIYKILPVGRVYVNQVAADSINAAAFATDAVAEIQAGLATSATQTTILNRIGAFTGTGINTVLGFLRALGAKAGALTPSDLSTGTTFDNTTDSQEAIAESLGGGATPASLWAYTTRTLTQAAASVISAVSGSTITIQRGDTLSVTLTGLGNISDYVSLDFTVKKDTEDDDDDAIIRIRKNLSGLTDGLLIINGDTATTATNGSITINDAVTGSITIALKAAEADDLEEAVLTYDVQKISATAVKTLTNGTCKVTAAGDVTRAVV